MHVKSWAAYSGRITPGSVTWLLCPWMSGVKYLVYVDKAASWTEHLQFCLWTPLYLSEVEGVLWLAVKKNTTPGCFTLAGVLSFTLPGMLGAPPVVFRTPIPSWGGIACRSCLLLVKKKPTKKKQTSSIGWRDERMLLLFCAFLGTPKQFSFFFHHSEFTCIISRAHSCN